MNNVLHSKPANGRIEWIDFARGIAIILVCLGHCCCPKFLKMWIYSFHMPLFFIISGITLSLDYSPKIFIRKKIMGIIVPYLVFCPVLVVLNNLIELLKGTCVLDIKTDLISILFQTHLTAYRCELWFLLSLFWGELVLYLIYRISSSSVMFYAISYTIFILGIIYNKCFGIPIIWNFDITFIAIGFIVTGYLLRKLFIEGNSKKILSNKWIPYLCGVLGSLFAVINWMTTGNQVDMIGNQYGNYLLFIASAFFNSVMVILLSTQIKGYNVVSGIGKNSIVYYIFHNPPIYIVISFFADQVGLNLNIVEDTYGVAVNIVVCLAITVIECIGCEMISRFLNRFCPIIIGKKKISTN